MSECAAAFLDILERSIARAGRDRDSKFNPLVLGEIQAVDDK
jgi:hypothetical protein